MPRYCIDADPHELADRAVHDLTPGKCPHLPIDEHQEDLGWHGDIDCALVRARLWYKTAKPCVYCCETRLSMSTATAMSTISTEKPRRN
jgi:hypothetical protein